MDNHTLNLSTCSFCVFIGGCIEDETLDSQNANNIVQKHFRIAHGIDLSKKVISK